MGIWDRLGTVIKSYLNDDKIDYEDVFKRGSSKNPKRASGSDPDLDAAYEELDDFLNGKEKSGENKQKTGAEAERKKRTVPNELKQDFAELGLNPDASFEECKEAYKKLLKIHHPDRHINHEGNLKKATEKTARVNASYERLAKWFRLSE